jgi:hypothetical protein
MNRRPVSTAGVLMSAAMITLAGVGTAVRVTGAGSPPTPANYLPPDNPSHAACVKLSKKNCNPDPSVYATFVAANPNAHAPSSNPRYIGEAAAIAEARGSLTTAPAYAKLMTYGELQAKEPGLAENAVPDPRRKVWVVTVQADAYTHPTGMTQAHLVHYFTDVIDGETGQMTDSCLGCDTVTH